MDNAHGTAFRVRRGQHPRDAVAGALALLISLATAGCASTGHLAEYDFRERTVGIVTVAPAHPDVFTHHDWWVRDRSLLEAVVRAAADIAREVEADRARVRLDSAVAAIDVSQRMSARVLEQSARQMRSRAVEDVGEADFEIELRVKRYGIEADSWNDPARFTIDADVILLDGSSGRVIWKSHVDEHARMGAGVPGWVFPDPLRGAVTAAQLATMSVEDMQRALESLADFCADRMVDKLRDGLEKVRD